MQFNLFISDLPLKVCVLLTGLFLAIASSFQSDSIPQLSPTYLLSGNSAINNAAGGQVSPQISKGSNGYLTVWQDYRGSLLDYSYNEYDLPAISELFAARLDVSGNLVDYTPIKIPAIRPFYYQPDIAWNGQHWLVTWQERRYDSNNCYGCFILNGVRVSEQGVVMDSTPIQLGPPSVDFSITSLTSDGTSWVAIKLPPYSLDGGSITAIRIAPNGQVMDLEGKIIATVPNNLRATGLDIAFASDEYLIIWGEGQRTSLNTVSTHKLKAQRLSLSLEKIGYQFDVDIPVVTENLLAAPRLASDGNNFLATWVGGMKLISHDGQIISGPLQKTGYAIPSDLCWDGNGYTALAFDKNIANQSSQAFISYRLSQSGQILSSPLLIGTDNELKTSISIASRFNGGAQFIWESVKQFTNPDNPNYFMFFGNKIRTTAIRPDGMTTSVVTIPQSAPRQSEPQIIANGNGYLVIYRSEVGDNSQILAQRLDANGSVLDQDPIVISDYPELRNPRVAWNGSVYLVVWEKYQSYNDIPSLSRVYGRFLSSTGTLLGTEFAITQGRSPDISALNSTFAVVTSMGEKGSVVRIAENGSILNTVLINMPLESNRLRVASAGNRWLIAWTKDLYGDHAPPCAQGVFLSEAGTLESPFGISDFSTNVKCHGLTLSVSRDEILASYGAILSPNSPDVVGGIVGRRINANGAFLGPSFVISTQGFWPTSTGSNSYITVWNDPRKEIFFPLRRGDIFGSRVSSKGDVLDQNGFALADSPYPERQPSIASSNGVAIIAYSAYVEAPYNTMRIHLRVIRNVFDNSPSAPTNLILDHNDWNQLTLVWQDQANNESGFKIERCVGQSCSDFAEIASVPPDVIKFNDSHLPPNTWLKYRVRAFNADGTSAYSNIVEVQTLEAPSFSITGRLTDRDGKGLANYSVTLTGSQSGFARTDQGGYYRLSSIAGGGNYRVTVQSPGPRVGFTTYYPNPGWVEFNLLSANQSANFMYNLTSPWVPPGATPTPTPTPAPTPTPTPPPGNDATILNPNFDQGGTNWATTGAVCFTNGIARLTPTNNYSPASILQWVQLTPGATYEVTADITATSSTRLVVGVKYDDSGSITNGPSVPYTNVTRPTTGRVRFTVPNSGNQVGFYAQANGSISNNSLATIDNFRLTRVN